MAVERGNSVLFDVQFIDETDAVAVVTSATLYLSYPDGVGKSTTSFALTAAASEHWTGKWASGVSDEGWVHWTAKASNDDRDFAGSGKFKITAGPANEKVTA